MHEVIQLQGAALCTGVRFAPAAPQLAPLVIITTKSIFGYKDHI